MAARDQARPQERQAGEAL
jgi:bifunctional non-homologous end joining protein LigD